MGAGNVSHTHPAGCSKSPTLSQKILWPGVSRLTRAWEQGRQASSLPSHLPFLAVPACAKDNAPHQPSISSSAERPLLQLTTMRVRVRLACPCGLQLPCPTLARGPLYVCVHCGHYLRHWQAVLSVPKPMFQHSAQSRLTRHQAHCAIVLLCCFLHHLRTTTACPMQFELKTAQHFESAFPNTCESCSLTPIVFDDRPMKLSEFSISTLTWSLFFHQPRPHIAACHHNHGSSLTLPMWNSHVRFLADIFRETSRLFVHLNPTGQLDHNP